jgi:hypothetical protein
VLGGQIVAELNSAGAMTRGFVLSRWPIASSTTKQPGELGARRSGGEEQARDEQLGHRGEQG